MDLDVVAVEVVVSDPWEFVDAEGSNVLIAYVRRAATSASHQTGFPLLLEFRDPIKASAAEGARFFVAESHGGGWTEYARLTNGESVPCRLTGVPAMQALGEHPLDVSEWRGRLPAARAELKRA